MASFKRTRLNLVDRLVAYVSPVNGVKRLGARSILAEYEAAKPSRLRKSSKDPRPPDAQVQRGAVATRLLARNLEQNHDIARGALRVLVNNVVGPNGIGIEPQPRRKNGEIHEEYAAALRVAYRDWCRRPEVTHSHHYAKVQRLMAKTWLRDGEVFAQRLVGPVPLLDHGTRVPYSLELFEADMIPMDYDDEAKRIRQGIERNAWGKSTAFWVYKAYPGDVGTSSIKGPEMKRIEASRMLHVASVDRIAQLRGVSEFASVITRLEDIKDYEESERVAAKIAAALTAYVKKGSPDLYNPEQPGGEVDANGNALPRHISMAPGQIIDSLSVGEEIGMIDSNRPNPNLVTFRQGQLRAVAAGLGGSYSSIARDYGGTYSSQRQELVEQWIHYAVLMDEFVGQFVQPVWEDFVFAAHISGTVPIPKDVDLETADEALFIGQSMPWIDPLKEAMAWHALVRDGFGSEVEVMRKRGINPRDALEQMASFRTKAKEKGLVLSSDAANDKLPAPATVLPQEKDEE